MIFLFPSNATKSATSKRTTDVSSAYKLLLLNQTQNLYPFLSFLIELQENKNNFNNLEML